ncbi:polycomb group protein embryonic flower 2 [Arabis alpina]|uniref:Polycomb group protein embryonic flower 2 n=1 Tax=Arabis alpina TaxID=50452 RepID=A0A087FXA6_ARAAL|nr:polycomb group protein embryonic flower 2 [Arabis alpina]
MCRKNGRDKSSPEEVVSADENLLVYVKPVTLYQFLRNRSQSNPSFLPRCLSYAMRANGKTKASYTGVILFNYKDCNNTIQKTEVAENCSCPFCLMRCDDFEGMQLHLRATHALFEFEFLISEEYQTVNVSVKLDAFRSEEEESNGNKFKPFFFCSKPRRRRQGVVTRPNECFLPLDSPDFANDTENGTALLNNGYRGLGYPEATFGMSGNTPPAIARSSLDSDAKTVLPTEAVAPPAKTKKLSAERSEARSHLLLQKRQFYHSHTNQPMSLEEVTSGQDSEDEEDYDVAAFEDCQMLDDFVDVTVDEKRFMHLWNSFVRKQRVLADGHVPWACEAFSKFHRQELLSCETLEWCMRIFLIKLWSHGLVDARTINNCSLILKKCDDDNSDTNNNNSVDHQNNNNNSVDQQNNNNNVDHHQNNNSVDHENNNSVDHENNNNNSVDQQNNNNNMDHQNNNNTNNVDHQNNNKSNSVDHQNNNNKEDMDVDKDGK